ncbi:hypothetical protein MKW92_035392, partial [Papaver armeniacum]
SEFKFNAPSHLVRPNLEVTFSQKFRTFKYQLRQNYFKIARGKAQIEAAIQAGLDPNAWKSKEEILANVPIGVTPSNWTAFVENEFKEGVKESHEKKSREQKEMHNPSYSWEAYLCEQMLSPCMIYTLLILLVVLKLYFVIVIQQIWIQMSGRKKMGWLRRIANTLG